LLELRQVGFEQGDVIGRSLLAAVAEQDGRRLGLAACCEERPEVGVGRDRDAVLLSRPVEHRLV
jgi:hypothetical protein